jgi:hypothetical protein
MHRRHLLALAAAAALVAPAPAFALEGEPAPAPAAPAPAVPAPGGTASETDPDVQALAKITDEMAKKVEEIRGLKFKFTVKRMWKSRDEARAEMLAEIDNEIPPSKMAQVSRAAAFYRQIPEGRSLKEIFADFIAAGAGGYYLPEKDVFSLIRGFNLDANRPIVFHELVHAVEDQYFDYNDRTKKHSDASEDDHATALHALVEGSARYFEDKFVDSEAGLRRKYFLAQQEGGADQAGALMELPAGLIISVAFFPYSNGAQFLETVLPAMGPPKEGEDVLARLYASPPTSTEQLLHPEVFLAKDMPQTVALPDVAALLGTDWKKELDGTMGELGTGLALNALLVAPDLMSQAQAVIKPPKKMPANEEEFLRIANKQIVEFKGATGTACTGWDGDRYSTYFDGKRVASVWVSTWDSGKDAREFAETYATQVLPKKWTVAAPTEEKEAAGRWNLPTTGAGATSVRVDGHHVFIAEAVPAASVTAVMDALAKSSISRHADDAVPAAK